MTSIRLRFVDWLQGLRDHVSKHFVQELRGAQMHSHAPRYVHKPVVVGVHHARAEGQIHNTVVHSGLCQEIHIINGRVGVPNLPELIANRDLVPALDHNLVGHFVAPLSDHRMVQAKNAGVEAIQ